MLAITVATLLAFVVISTADIVNLEFAAWSARGTDDDLLRFVTRPDLTPPKLEVVFHKREKCSPGYLFVAPYDCLSCSHRATTTYVTQQIGPHIYTQDGELVWSGIDLFPDRKVFDFRPVTIEGADHLALIAPQDEEWHVFSDGAAILLNSSYQPVQTINSTELGHKIDLHEFNVLDDGKTALIAVKAPRDTTDADGAGWKGKVMECYFMEVDMGTHEPLFHWQASVHVNLTESTNPPPSPGDAVKHWDWFHLNSLDKDNSGNYLVSARATDTIYLISSDGSVLWRLGGRKSSFKQDFQFSRQHNARIRRQTERHMIISFFDNAADDSGNWEPTSSSSSLLIVQLDTKTMTATLNHRHPRPDGGYSEAKGNVQYLPNGNILGGWGENAYITEYSKPGGEMVYEASFASRRFANYRAYKMDFVAQPTSIPVTKSFVSTNSHGNLGTTIYVSWNGATQVALWRYYSHTAKQGVETAILIGTASKTGFETSFLAAGYHPIIFVEAVDVFGNSLANSSLQVTELPLGFHDPESPLLSSLSQQSREGKEPSLYSTLQQKNLVNSLRDTAESTLVKRTIVAFVSGIAVTVFWSQFQNSRRSFAWRPVSLHWTTKGE